AGGGGEPGGTDAAEPVNDRAGEDPGGALADGERGEEQRGDGGGLAVVVLDRQGEPAVRRAFAELAAEHDKADEQQPHVHPAAQPLAERRGTVPPRRVRRDVGRLVV